MVMNSNVLEYRILTNHTQAIKTRRSLNQTDMAYCTDLCGTVSIQRWEWCAVLTWYDLLWQLLRFLHSLQNLSSRSIYEGDCEWKARLLPNDTVWFRTGGDKEMHHCWMWNKEKSVTTRHPILLPSKQRIPVCELQGAWRLFSLPGVLPISVQNHIIYLSAFQKTALLLYRKRITCRLQWSKLQRYYAHLPTIVCEWKENEW